ncbi:MAG: prepilin-type N-terminal cleavage/methylation domain-containing protein [Bacilli bacterium]|nr:prepilin-type N-terminal cleavage/methylation domain-containing protein [Bacilli bacterium]
MKNRKGFTLVELLAVITILSVILIIAVPQIMNTIKVSKLGAMESSAKIIAKDAEKKYYMKKMEDKNYVAAGIPCTDITKMSSDYGSCTISYSNNGIATVTLKGATGGKFDGITCTGTKNNMSCVERVPGPPVWIYAYGNITSVDQGVENYADLDKQIFIRFNKNDLSEKNICIMYKSAERSGEPACLVSKDTYNTRNNENSEWSQIEALFGSSNCVEEVNSIRCYVSLPEYWQCITSSNSTSCTLLNQNTEEECSLKSDGTVSCIQ